MARAIAGSSSDPEVLVPARRLVVAQALIKRAQSARNSLTESLLESINCGDNSAVADVFGRLRRLERYERSALAQRRFAVRDLAAVSTSVLAAGFLQNEAKIAEEDQQVYSPACEAPAG